MLSYYKNRKKWFTLVEVLFVCSVFAIMVVWIILAINRSYTFMNNTRLQVRATNFAREWVEMMFNIRDTNRRKHAWKKDMYWLCLDCSQPNVTVNSTSQIFMPWIYKLSEKLENGSDYSIIASVITPSTNINEFYSDDWFWNDNSREEFKIPFTWTYTYLSWWNNVTWDMADLLWSETEFYRVVRVYGIYKKNSSSADESIWGTITNYTNNTPKEMRFCVKVFYRTNAPHSTELCSIMTNFEE